MIPKFFSHQIDIYCDEIGHWTNLSNQNIYTISGFVLDYLSLKTQFPLFEWMMLLKSPQFWKGIALLRLKVSKIG